MGGLGTRQRLVAFACLVVMLVSVGRLLVTFSVPSTSQSAVSDIWNYAPNATTSTPPVGSSRTRTACGVVATEALKGQQFTGYTERLTPKGEAQKKAATSPDFTGASHGGIDWSQYTGVTDPLAPYDHITYANHSITACTDAARRRVRASAVTASLAAVAMVAGVILL